MTNDSKSTALRHAALDRIAATLPIFAALSALLVDSAIANDWLASSQEAKRASGVRRFAAALFRCFRRPYPEPRTCSPDNDLSGAALSAAGVSIVRRRGGLFRSGTRALPAGLSALAAVAAMAPISGSSAPEGSGDEIWRTALGHTRACGAALNESFSSGTSCLFGSGLNFALDQGLGLADDYGKRAFGEQFQLVGSLTWSSISGATGLSGDVDIVLPLAGADTKYIGRGWRSALFLQQGVTRQWDVSGSFQSDLRHGAVYRFRVSDDTDADILGISMFHQANVERGHEVLVPAVDYSGRWGRGAFRYFSPITDWTPGRPGYEERALEGMELSIGADVTSTLRLNTTGYRWEAPDGSGRWTSGARADIGWRPHPWLDFSAGYGRFGEGRGAASFLATLRVPLGSPKRPPAWEGLGVVGGGSVPRGQDLWRPTEGIGPIRIATRASAASLVEGAEVRFLQDTVGSGNAVQLEVVLPSAAPRDLRVAVRLVPGAGENPAVPGEDYVDEPVETTISRGSATATVSIRLLLNGDMREDRSLSATVTLLS